MLCGSHGKNHFHWRMSHMQKTKVLDLFGKNFECVTYNQGRYDAHLKYCSAFYYLTLGYIGKTEKKQVESIWNILDCVFLAICKGFFLESK